MKQGDRLFLIDPRPYQATLDQAMANRLKDQAQLQGAQRDLERYGKLVGSGFQTRQSFEDQQATVAQLQASMQADQATIEQARLNLGYTDDRRADQRAHRRAAGRCRQLRAGQRRHAAGLDHPDQADRCQLHPAGERTGRDPAQPGVASAGGGRLRGGRQTLLGKGALTFIDNHIDDSTGTIALKGKFANANEALWPGDFVDVRLIIATAHNAITVPAQTVMAGPEWRLRLCHPPGRHGARRACRWPAGRTAWP